jgi:hypothetical protein
MSETLGTTDVERAIFQQANHTHYLHLGEKGYKDFYDMVCEAYTKMPEFLKNKPLKYWYHTDIERCWDCGKERKTARYRTYNFEESGKYYTNVLCNNCRLQE